MYKDNDYVLSLTVLPSHADKHGFAKLAALSDMLADCERLHIDQPGILSAYLNQGAYGLFQCYRQVDILRRPKTGETLTVATRITETKFTSGTRNTFILDANGSMVVAAYAVGAFVDMQNGRIAPIDREVAKSIPRHPAIDMPYTPRKITLPATAATQLDAYRIPRDYLDSYGHVNNAKYVHQTIEHFREDTVRRIRIEYKAQQKQGDTVLPYLYQDGNVHTLNLMSDNNTPFAYVEYTLEP